jgi:hypothetical protein
MNFASFNSFCPFSNEKREIVIYEDCNRNLKSLTKSKAQPVKQTTHTQADRAVKGSPLISLTDNLERERLCVGFSPLLFLSV